LGQASQCLTIKPSAGGAHPTKHASDTLSALLAPLAAFLQTIPESALISGENTRLNKAHQDRRRCSGHHLFQATNMPVITTTRITSISSTMVQRTMMFMNTGVVVWCTLVLVKMMIAAAAAAAA
jgi:hypothetical protein